MRVMLVSCTGERREVAHAENRRPFEVRLVRPGFRRDLGSHRTRYAPYVRCGSYSPELRLILEASCLLFFVRLAHDGQFVGAVLFFVVFLVVGASRST
jgi:hypothetical protein